MSYGKVAVVANNVDVDMQMVMRVTMKKALKTENTLWPWHGHGLLLCRLRCSSFICVGR